MKPRSIRRLATLAALAACALTVGPLTSQASAVPTKTVAHSTILDLRTADGLYATVPLRPSAHVTRTDTGGPVAGRFVLFTVPFGLALERDLCAVKTDVRGFAQCDGLVRLTNPLLALGKFVATFPAQGEFGASKDTGQLLTIGNLGSG
jgi:hypothetical protein